MRKDERLKTIYEVIAPHIVRSESNWREYLSFAAGFFKHTFDNVLLVYAQNPNVTMLATVKQWNDVGRVVNKDEKGLAVCDYENAKLSISHLFDITQTHGRELKPTDWQLEDSMKSETVKRLAFSHGFEANDLPELLRALAGESAADHYETYLQDLSTDIEGHLFSELPKDGLEMQFLELLTDSITYFIGKRCGLPDETLILSDGMVTVGHFNTLPLVARLGNAVTAISKNVLLELERTIRIVNKERKLQYEKSIDGTELHRERRSLDSQSPSIEQQRERPTPRKIWQDGTGLSERKSPTTVYDFENGWHVDGENARGSLAGDSEHRSDYTTDADRRPDAEHGGHLGTDTPSEQPASVGGGNRTERADFEAEITPQPIPAEKELSDDGSFLLPGNTPVLEEAEPDEPKKEFINVIICPPMAKPYLTVLENTLVAKRRVVGGTISTIEIDPGIDAICADDVNFENAPINRMINGQPVFGTFIIARIDENYNYTSLFDTDIEKYLRKFASHLVDITKIVADFEEADRYDSEEQIHTLLNVTEIEDVPRADEVDTFVPIPAVVQQLTLFGSAPKDKESELIEYIIGQQGTSSAGGKQRIFDFSKTNPTRSAFASFLKNEYGTGGSTVNENGIHFVNYGGKGISFDWIDENGESHDTEITWLRAAIVVHKLIVEGRYLSEPTERKSEKQPQPSTEIQILDEALDSHNGQIDMRLQAVQDELTVGTIAYSIYEDSPHIGNIEVLEDYRRQGIGTKMVRYLQGQFPDTEIEWGMTTDDGAAFKEAATYSVVNEDYANIQNRLDEVNEQLVQNKKDWNAGVVFSDEGDDGWTDLTDEQRELEDALAELRPQKNYVRLAFDEKNVAPHAVPVLAIPRSARQLPPRPIHANTNFHYSQDYDLYPNGQKTKYKNNIEAIKLLKKIESQRRLATSDEQIVLARYVGWGGLANVFSDKAAGWEKEYQELKTLLDEAEYTDAMNSTITAYYTEPELIRHIYPALERFGFHGGPDRKLLDPAMGTGNFYSVLPENLADTKLYGAELDSITGRIAKQLYPTAEVSVMGYEATRFEDNSIDVAIGNIPFNSIKVFDGRYDKLNFLIHDYFISKTLDLVKPGGLIAFITSKGTMDKTDDTVRKYIAERAELIGAIRLPNTAFKALAGTEVTTDILFLQKRTAPITLTNEDEISWIKTETDRNNGWIRYNYYFFEHPEMVLGEMKPSRNMYGREDGTACIAPEGHDLYAEFDRAVGQLHATFTAAADQPAPETVQEENTPQYIQAPEGTKNSTYLVQDDRIFYCEQNNLIPQDYTGKKAERIKGLCEIRTALLEVIGVQSREYAYNELEQAQAKLSEAYDRFVKKNGAINSTGNILAFSDDDQFPLLRSIEDEKEDKSGWDKAAIFYKATIKSYYRPDHADTAEEALQISLNTKLQIDLPYMFYLTGREPEQLITELGERIFLNPHKYYGNALEGWELSEEYLSGHVRDKLLYAKQKAEDNPELFTRNVQALEAAQPILLAPSDINVRISAPWIPIEYYRQFMYETFDTPGYLRADEYSDNRRIDVEYLEYTTTWRIANKGAERESVKVNQTYGTKRTNAYEIYEVTLNQQSSTVRDPVPYVDKNGKDQIKYIVNAQETMIARSKQNQIKEAFSTWLFAEQERREILLAIYNERFNTIKPREYDGSHLVFPGMSAEMELKPHQANFAARVIYSGTGLAGHVVGAGKTAAMIAAGMYMKQLGAIKKPIFVVPNPLTSQWAVEFYRFFPNANLLVTTVKDFEMSNRNRFVSKIAMNDYDAVIIGHSQFERIPISAERQETQLRAEINQISFAIEKMKEEKGENWAIKQMVIFQTNLRDRLDRLSAEHKKDDLLTFEQLGIDFMFVDEAHYFKNCFTYTKMRNVAGIGKSSSQRAFDMLLKCQYLQEMNNGQGVVFATGTPVSNSMSEMFVLQRYLQPQELRKMGLSYFDNWAATFGEIISSLEITPEGNGYRMRQRFAKFHNLPELMSVFKLVADIQTSDMLGLPTPAIEGGKPTVVAVDATPYQKEIMDSFVVRAERIRKREVEPSEDNMLKLTGEARLMAIDPRLVYDNAPSDPNSKLNRCIGEAYQIWEDSKDARLTQLVFCDSGTPKPGKFNVYDETKRILLERGVPADEVAFVHDAKTEVQRDTLFDKVRSGEIRILLGSTSKLGTGVNVQKRLVAVHHLDCPWKPSDIEQRSGRILRQGNDNKVVKILQYVTKGTFDSYLWQIQEQKLRYITQIMTGKSISRSCEDMDETVLTAAQVKAVATDNPLLLEKMQVDNKVDELKLLRGSWQNEQAVLERNVSRHYPNSIASNEKNIAAFTADIAILSKTARQEFQITIDGKVFDERGKAGERLILLSKLDDWKGRKATLVVGSYRGLELSLERGSFDSLSFVLKGSQNYRSDLGFSELGAITRIENAVDRIPKLLTDETHRLQNFQNQLAEAKKLIGKPFEQEQELAEMAARQSEINTKLEFKELQQQEDVIMDDSVPSDKDLPLSDELENDRDCAEL